LILKAKKMFLLILITSLYFTYIVHISMHANLTSLLTRHRHTPPAEKLPFMFPLQFMHMSYFTTKFLIDVETPLPHLGLRWDPSPPPWAYAESLLSQASQGDGSHSSIIFFLIFHIASKLTLHNYMFMYSWFSFQIA